MRRAAGGVAATLAALPVQYADYTLWQHAVLGEESDPAERDLAAAFVLARASAGAAGSARSAERPAASGGVEPSRRQRRGLLSAAELHAGLLKLARDSQASLFMVLQAGLAALLSRLGAGTDIAIGTPIAGRTDEALDDLVGFFVNTLVLRTDTSGNPSFRELIGAGARRQPCGLQPPGCAVRAAGGGAQPGALAVAASAVPGDAGVPEQRGGRGWSWPGLRRGSSRWRPRARSSTCR